MHLQKQSTKKLDAQKNRIFGLDILRAFAILVVIVSHSVTYLSPSTTKFITNIALDGVTMFFVLSGFLIGNILLKTFNETSEISLGTLTKFWYNRWARTLPNYFLVLSVVILLYNLEDFNAPGLKSYYLFLQNFNKPHPGYFIEAWSLAVEEWFYVIIPPIIYFLIKSSVSLSKAVLITAVFIILFSTINRMLKYDIYYPISMAQAELIVRMQVLTRLDSIVFGLLGALIFKKLPLFWKKNSNIYFLCGILMLTGNKYLQQIENASDASFYYIVFHYSINAIATLLLIPKLYSIKTASGVLFKLISFVSLISYSLYLTNLTLVQNFIIPYINDTLIVNRYSIEIIEWIDLSLFYLLTFVISWLLYKFIEKPSIELRNKYQPSFIWNSFKANI